MRRAGIIGAGGNAGKGAVSILKNSGGILLKLGCRRIEKLAGGTENVELCRVDIFQQEELEAFVKDCDYVINCAGPSWKVKDRVARSCFRQGAVYIDVAGGQALIRDLKMLGRVRPGTGITSAGVYPGLSEIFLKWVCGQCGGKIASIEEIFYGNDVLSDAALQDICESLKDGEGDAFCQYSRGEVLKISSAARTSIKLPGIPNRIHLLPVLNPAFVHALGSYPVDKAVFYLGLPREASLSELIRLRSSLETHTSEEILTEETRGIFYSRECRRCFGIAVEVRPAGSQAQQRYILSGETDWNYLTGAVAALALLHLGERKGTGIRYVHEMAKPEKIIGELKERGLISVKKYVKKET